MNPAKPFTKINRLKAIAGRPIAIDGPLEFTNDADKQTFLGHLNGTIPPTYAIPEIAEVIDLSYSLESRLIGKNPATERQIYSSQTHTGTPAYVRNSDCWAADIDLTCVSVWNSDGGVEKGGTAISPRHILFAHHFTIANGATIRFVTKDNVIVERTLTSSAQVGATDIRIGLLNSDLPDTISFASVLPSNWTDYLDLIGAAALVIDKEEKAHVKRVLTWEGGMVTFASGIDPLWLSFNEDVISGDSGNPLFVLLGSKPLLVGSLLTSMSVPDIASNFAAINAVMTSLGGGYQLSPADLIGRRRIHSVRSKRILVSGIEGSQFTISTVGAALQINNTHASGIGLSVYGEAGGLNAYSPNNTPIVGTRDTAGIMLRLSLEEDTSFTVWSDGSMELGAGGNPKVIPGTGNPEGSVTAPIGSVFLRKDGGASTALYIKESGTGNTGWVAVAQSPPVGTVTPYAGTTAPSGYALCFGQAVSRTTYAALFAAIGTTYGVGDGSTTFNLPDLRGRVAAGKDNMGGTAANRLFATLVGGTLGAVGGSEQMPPNPTSEFMTYGVDEEPASTNPMPVVQPTIILNYIIKLG